jgi:hypothetical protein
VGAGKPYATIQSAINAAAAGDTVLVYDGTYVENINFLSKNITVQSQTGAANTIIDGGAKDVVVRIGPGTLDGFTIQHGYSQTNGGGIYCLYSTPSPLIRNCIIKDNQTLVAGGGVMNPVTMINCLITGNSADFGGAMLCDDYFTTLINCTVSGNYDIWNESVLTLINSIVWPDSIHYPGTNVINSDISVDPLFVGGGNYHLTAGSPCINTGTSTAAAITTSGSILTYPLPW